MSKNQASVQKRWEAVFNKHGKPGNIPEPKNRYVYASIIFTDYLRQFLPVYGKVNAYFPTVYARTIAERSVQYQN